MCLIPFLAGHGEERNTPAQTRTGITDLGGLRSVRLNYGGFSNIIAWAALLANPMSHVTVHPWGGDLKKGRATLGSVLCLSDRVYDATASGMIRVSLEGRGR